MASPLLTAAVPSIVNGVSTLFTNASNQANYQAAQERANQFARSERIAAQNWNSLPNQFAQMAQVGMNPNLMQGGDFMSTQPVSNQSVMPPQNIAPQMPADSLTSALVGQSQAKVNASSSLNLDAQTATENLLRNSKLTMANSQIRLADSQADLNRSLRDTDTQQRENAFRTFRQIDVNTALLEENRLNTKAHTSFLEAQTAGQHIQNAVQGAYGMRTAEATLHKIITSMGVDNATAAYLWQNRALLFQQTGILQKENQLFHDTYQNRVHQYQYLDKGAFQHLKIQKTESGMLEFQFHQIKSYDDLMKWGTIANQYLEAGLKLEEVLGNSHKLNPISNEADHNLQRFSTLTGGQGLGFTNPSVQPMKSKSFDFNPYSGGSFGKKKVRYGDELVDEY